MSYFFYFLAPGSGFRIRVDGPNGIRIRPGSATLVVANAAALLSPPLFTNPDVLTAVKVTVAVANAAVLTAVYFFSFLDLLVSLVATAPVRYVGTESSTSVLL